jgi:hypothetical protein
MQSAYDLAKSDGWISVDDRLPDEDQDVLVCRKVGVGVMVMGYRQYKGLWYPYGYPHPDPAVTHWMSLPTPPKQ